MGNKVSPIIILILLAVVIAIGIVIFSMFNTNSNKNVNGNNVEQESVIKPMLDLSLNTSEKDQEKVIISAKASVEDGSEIVSILLPDQTVIEASEVNYEVTENGNYKFSATAENSEVTEVSIKVTNIREISAQNPYIPEGFTQVEDTTVEEGFVIEDENGNQYVWVPVESGKLTRNTMLNDDYEETNGTASALVNSVAKNYGFYIGRYEASEYDLNGEKVAVSMNGKTPWTNITYQDAIEFANNSAIKFGYDGYYTSMVNSYAWDTILEWMNQKAENFSSSTNFGNYSGSIYPTGTTESDKINNICDIAGNIREWTTEIYKAESTKSSSSSSSKENENVVYRVVRGGSANLKRTPASHIGYPENTYDTYWGFRMILYK